MIVGNDFYAAVMAKIGASYDANAQSLCFTWQTYEGGSAAWNPWNTTENWTGATNYNSAGVKNYPDEPSGINATAATLLNGYYPAIVAAFRSKLPMNQWGLNRTIIAEINTWGTHGFADHLVAIAVQPSPSPPPITEEEPMSLVIIATEDNNNNPTGTYLVDSTSGATGGIAQDNAPSLPHVTMRDDAYNAFVSQAQKRP